MLEENQTLVIVPAALHAQRLDVAMAALFSNYSRSQLQQWIKKGQVLVNGKAVVLVRHLVHAEDRIELQASPTIRTPSQPQDIQLSIIYQDEALIVINKPAEMVVHPGAGNPDQTLVNALLHHFPELQQLPRAGIVHRLDKDTTGLLLVARTLSSHHALVQALQHREIHRHYQAIVMGKLISGATIEAPIGRDPHQRTHMTVIESGKPAITHYRVLERYADYTRVQVQLETGRTHQIRVHFQHIEHPVVGDPIYGGRFKLPKGASEHLRHLLQTFKRQALHAEILSLTHPLTKEVMKWTAPLPEDFKALIQCLQTENR